MQMNEAQQKAVHHKNGPMLVLAGPGSGKTLVITERTRWLIDENGVPEDQILVITFTKAAANEMKMRFLATRDGKRTGVSFGTFHAIFFTILKHAYRFTSANIVREEVRHQYMKEIIHRMQLEFEDEKELIADLFSEISLVKGSRINPQNYYSISCSDEVFRSIYHEYDKRLRRANLIDFDDMLLMCYELLTQRKDILALWQNKFKYILVDEFQDINLVQYEIVKLLAAPQNNLFIVGDDDQSIYRFRGAKPEIMLEFPTDYPESKKLLLDMNYRSSSNILDASNYLVKNNENRFEKNVRAVKDAGEGLVFRHFPTLSEENTAVTEEILSLYKKGIPLSQMAILVRTTLGAGSLVHKLMEYNIPFHMKDSLPNIFDHWITRDLLCYIQIAMGKSDRGLFLQIINRPKRYISRDCFDTPMVDLDSVKDYYEDKNWVLERIDQLEYDLALLSGMKPYAAVNYIRKGIGYEDYLKEYAEFRKIKSEELIDVLDEIQESAREFQSYEDWFASMEDYKEELKKQAIDNKELKKEGVMLATMHSAKGLEFEAVFIVDANEGITPHKKAVLAADLEEERRLFYVAMTRAKSLLYIFSARERYNKTVPWSRFIDEIMENKTKQK
jgi:DNA helicase-2/ATP-dependent DNA helicase PcrA